MGKCKGKIVDCDGPYDCYDPSDDECYKNVGNSKPQPVPDNNKKKTTPIPAPVPKNVCKDDYGIEISDKFFDPEMKTERGIKAFKDFLKKYYPELVTRIAGSPDNLDKAKYNDCIVIKLFNTSDPVRNRIIGDYVYDDWKDFVNGWENSTSKTPEEFQTWLRREKKSSGKINATKEDWEKIVGEGWFSSGGRISEINNNTVLLYKYDSQDNILKFDALTETGELDFEKIKSDLEVKDGSISYYYNTYPVDYTGDVLYPKISDEYQLYLGETGSLRTKKTATIGLESPVVLKENYFRKFLLEKIREKNVYKTIFVEDIKTPQTSQPTVIGKRGGTKINTETKTETDVFGLNNPENNLVTTEAKKNFINTKTPTIQILINRGARSNDFLAWNTLAASLDATELTYKDKDGKDITIDENNSFNVGEPAQKGQYTEQPFYNVLNITGNELNTGKIYTPISVTNKQPYIDVKVSIPFCRTQLINYLKDGLSQNYSGNPQQNWNRKYEICGCNQRGGYEPFKFYRKLPQFGKNQTGREKLDVRPNSSVFTQTDKIINPETGEEEVFVGDVGGSASPFIPVLNKKLNWEEIKNILSGGIYKSRDGVNRTIDSELVIAGFDEGGDCVSNKFISAYPYKPTTEIQKESFDERIDNKLLESIKDKNKKESIIENVLKNLLKDK
jgi:hypothetical protein